jgi:hypothetical protein
MKTQESKDYSPADYHSRRFKVCDLPEGVHDLEEVEILVTYTGEGSARKGIAVDNVVVPLFKAAPDLLAGLQSAEIRILELSPHGYVAPELWEIRSAIAKATGEG